MSQGCTGCGRACSCPPAEEYGTKAMWAVYLLNPPTQEQVERDFWVDTDRKEISLRASGRGHSTVHHVNGLYSYLQELFARAEYMDSEVPMHAQNQIRVTMVNGWKITPEAQARLVGKVVVE